MKSNLKKVELVALDVARNVLKTVPGAVPDFEPTVRFHTFAAATINFTVGLRAMHLNDQSLIKSEFIKEVHERFNTENIHIPYAATATQIIQQP